MALLKEPNRERGFNKERIIRVLLNRSANRHNLNDEGNLTKYKLAQEAGASEPWTRQYTDRLDEEGLVQGTSIVKPRKLYEKWLDLRIKPSQLQVSLQQPMKLLQETELEYALTTYQAENLHQGLLFKSTTDFYISPEEISKWIGIVEEKGMLGGGNTRIQVLDKHVFYNQQEKEGFTTVSVPQIILDLLDEGGPCEEAADKLIKSFHGETQ